MNINFEKILADNPTQEEPLPGIVEKILADPYFSIDKERARKALTDAENRLKKYIEKYPNWGQWSVNIYEFEENSKKYAQYMIMALGSQAMIVHVPYEYGNPRDCGMGAAPEHIQLIVKRSDFMIKAPSEIKHIEIESTIAP